MAAERILHLPVQLDLFAGKVVKDTNIKSEVHIPVKDRWLHCDLALNNTWDTFVRNTYTVPPNTPECKVFAGALNLNEEVADSLWSKQWRNIR